MSAPVTVPAPLRDWLARDHPAAPTGGGTVEAWFARLAGPCRPVLTVVAGCPVAHHASGPPFAAACDGRVLVRADAPAALDPQPLSGLPGWVAVDARPPDVGFARGEDALARLVAAAAGAVAPRR